MTAPPLKALQMYLDSTLTGDYTTVTLTGDNETYLAVITSASDYYPFGVQMPTRNINPGDYRFGFNGMEVDDEVKGTGNSYDFAFRIYDSRIGRFLSTDPVAKEYPWNSPYAFAENDVIRSVDLEGLEKFVVTGNTITFKASYAAFKNRPDGGNVPNGMDIKAASKSNWDQLNQQLSTESYGLRINYDENGQVTSVSSGTDMDKLEFDITVEVFDDANTPKFKQFAASEEFAGVYLFGDNVNFGGDNINLSSTLNPATTKSHMAPGRRKEAVLFKDEAAFNSDNETHESGHTFGLGHFGIEIENVQKYSTGIPLMGKLGSDSKVMSSGTRYPGSGLMKYSGASGSSVPKSTEVNNLLNYNPGEKN